MRNKILLTLLAIFILVLAGNEALCVKKKPKLEQPESKETFTYSNPQIFHVGASRPDEFITPDKSSLLDAEPLFEWRLPECTESSPCAVYIEKKVEGKNNLPVFTQKGITENEYLLENNKMVLEKGEVYNFYVLRENLDKNNLEDSIEINEAIRNPLKLYVLSNKEAKNIKNKINSIESENNKVKLIEQTNIYLNNGLWYDAIAIINHLICTGDNIEEVQEFKDNLYMIIAQKDNN